MEHSSAKKMRDRLIVEKFEIFKYICAGRQLPTIYSRLRNCTGQYA